jgi:sugar lactone lactonase YvrE
VERFAESGVSDGLLFTADGIYVSALEEGSIKLVNTEGQVETIVRDPRIIWPDSFALGPDGGIWFTTSQIHLGPQPPSPYRILKVLPEAAEDPKDH